MQAFIFGKFGRMLIIGPVVVIILLLTTLITKSIAALTFIAFCLLSGLTFLLFVSCSFLAVKKTLKNFLASFSMPIFIYLPLPQKTY